MATLENPSEASGDLIAGQHVAGTDVYNRSGEKLGSIRDVMIDKKSGRIAFAILSFGGFLGIGDRYHPLPWATLSYDKKVGGYVVDLDPSVLEGAPAYGSEETIAWGDEAWQRRLHDYYGASPYWTSVP